MNNQAQNKASVLLIGDSISVQYGPYLQSSLKSAVNWVGYSEEARLGALTDLDKPQDLNCGDSTRALGVITDMLKKSQGKIDLVLANCGLHDIKTDPATGSKQTPLQSYQDNLKQIVAITREYEVPLIWMRTTLVNSAIHNSLCTDFQRFEQDVEDYNKAADDIMWQAGIPSIDLWQFTRQLGTDDELFCDHVHYEIWARQFQGAYVAGYIQSYLDNAATA